MSFTLLTESQEQELHRLSRFYWKEALRCEKSKAHLAGSVMLASALEALLMLIVDGFADEVEATNVVPTRKGKPIPLLDWDLGQLLKVAKAAGWLPSGLDINDDWNLRKAKNDNWYRRNGKIGDYAEVIRMVRNLIHPGRYLKDHSPSRVTGKYLERQFEIVLLCRDWLAERNSKSLREHMRQEELL